uniref:PiggyBac transposable element-derived protein domain-containing protein n=1 Tax=Cuerna arida TaxID=1464854 RepID=A0A1B6FHL7_9HEMI
MNKERYGRDRDTKNTTLEELKALFGLLYYAGVLKSSHLNAEELWDDEGTGVDIFRCVMSIQRFRFLVRMLRFDDKRTRRQRIAIDKFAPFREVFEYIVNKCKENFSVGEYTTIDEMLWAFRGRCGFRQYMRNKPAKYGLKVFSLVDARTFYVLNMEMYLGKQLPGPLQDLDQRAAPVVVRLVDPIRGSNRNVTFDNWFTSFPLCAELLNTHKLTSVGTVRKNKSELPREFLDTKNRNVNSSMFGFGKNLTTLVSYVPKPRKVVLVTSTMHYNKQIDESTGDQKKPEMITFYNSTKGGVDVVDEMCGNYSVARKSNCWPLTCFFHLLDIVALNSLVVCSWNDKDVKPV